MTASRRVLATDLDGTLIPLNGDPQHQIDLVYLSRHFQQPDLDLVYVTGRHFDSVLQAIGQHALPQPDWVIANVGTAIFRRGPEDRYQTVGAYDRWLEQLIAGMPIDVLRDRISAIDGLQLQEEQKQSRFKLSYYAEAGRLMLLVDQIQQRLREIAAPYSLISSVDPFNGDGLIDLLPTGVSKAGALEWWRKHIDQPIESIAFAGDSGNDLAAMIVGYRTIVVANADRELAARVGDAHRESGWAHERLHLASASATSGVLEGCRRFGLVR